MKRSYPWPLGLCLFAALGACSPTKTLRERTVTPIGPEGGVARSADGQLSIAFGVDVVTATVDITIETRRDVTHPDLVALVYEIGPASLTLARDVELRIALDEAGAARNPTIVQVEGDRLIARASSSFDPATNVGRATLDHFSMWSAAAQAPPGDAGVPPDAGDVDGAVPPDAGVPDTGASVDAGSVPDGSASMDASLPDAGTSTTPPSIVATVLPDADRCSTYVERLQVMGGNPPFTWSVSAGALPAGIELEADGLLHGATHDAARGYGFTAQVRDGSGQTATLPFTIDVTAVVDGVQWIAMLGRVPATTGSTSHLWVVDVCRPGSTPIEVTPVGGHDDVGAGQRGVLDEHYQLAMAPNGRALVYFGVDPSRGNFDMYVVDLRGATPARGVRRPWVAPAEGPYGGTLVMSDDGTKVAGANGFALHMVDVTDPANPGVARRIGVPFGESLSVWFSPNASWLAYWDYESIKLMDLSGLAAGNLGPPVDTRANLSWSPGHDLQWTRDSRALFYSDTDSDFTPPNTPPPRGLYWTTVGSTTPVRLGPTTSAQTTPSVGFARDDHLYASSPDGTKVFAIYPGPSGLASLHVGTVSGAAPGPLVAATTSGANDTSTIFAARWSPNSQRIMLSGVQASTGYRSLFVVDVSGALPRPAQVVSAGALGHEVSNLQGNFHWSPDGLKAAYVVNSAGGDELWVTDMATLASQSVNVPYPNGEILRLEFSPDSRRIAAVTRHGAAGHNLHVVDVSGAVPGAWTRVHPATTSANDDLVDAGQDLYASSVQNPNPRSFWTADARSIVFHGAFATPGVDEVWIVDVTAAPPLAPRRISPSNLGAGPGIIRTWASGDYAREPYLQR